jgi:hypothetical protein
MRHAVVAWSSRFVMEPERLESPEPAIDGERPRPHRAHELLVPDAADLVRDEEAAEITEVLPPEGSDDGIVVRQEESGKRLLMGDETNGEDGGCANSRVAVSPNSNRFQG